MPDWINTKLPYRRAHLGETCAQCYPKLCSCPQSNEEKISCLKSALAENVWTNEERQNIKKELMRLGR